MQIFNSFSNIFQSLFSNTTKLRVIVSNSAFRFKKLIVDQLTLKIHNGSPGKFKIVATHDHLTINSKYLIL